MCYESYHGDKHTIDFEIIAGLKLIISDNKKNNYYADKLKYNWFNRIIMIKIILAENENDVTFDRYVRYAC